MILLVHLLFGAAIGSVINNIPLAILLAFLSHYLLDILPHVEYDIENIKKKQWKNTTLQFAKIFLDFCLGILLILIFSKNQPIIYLCAILAIIPDVLSILNLMFKNKVLQTHSSFHQGKIHFLRDKKISNFWRIASQIIAIIIAITLFKI
jgi:uncharacterized membrane protein